MFLKPEGCKVLYIVQFQPLSQRLPCWTYQAVTLAQDLSRWTVLVLETLAAVFVFVFKIHHFWPNSESKSTILNGLLLNETLRFSEVLILDAFKFCQAQPKLQVQLEAELAFISISPPPGQVAGNERNLLFNVGKSTLSESNFLLLKRWKMTSMENDLRGRWP